MTGRNMHMKLERYLPAQIFLVFAAAAFLFLVFFHQSPDIQAGEKKAAGTGLRLAAAGIPDHEVQYAGELSPDWKVNWDLARELYREEKYREALVQYELLLNQKENIDEARWEYVTLLIRQERWQQAGEQLERLMGSDPANIEYRFALAEVSVNAGRLDEAVRLYKDLYASVPGPAGTARALEGLVRALRLGDEQREVYFYLAKLVALKPEIPEFRIELASLALQTGQLDTARDLLAALEQWMPENPDVLQLQAVLQEHIGNRKAEAEYRQKLVSINPRDLESHTLLFRYYRDLENWPMGLRHLDILLREKPNDAEILEAAAEMNLRLDRIDRALEYYEAILAMQPNNKTVLKKKTDAQKRLAEDLVVLVEHNGSQKLWQDLVKVTSDRAGVYRQIASLLMKKGYTEELVEVLTLICLEDPYDEKTLAQLAALLKKNGRDGELRLLLENQEKERTVNTEIHVQ